MPGERAAAAIRDRVGGDWSIFDRLARQPEAQLRGLLRSHREGAFASEGGSAAVSVRRSLDEALDRLMLLEVGIELGVLDQSALPVAPSLVTLLHSGAFARYLNASFYFGVRFAARRILGPASLEGPPAPDTDLNDLPTALPCPPPVAPVATEEVDEVVLQWLESSGPSADDRGAALGLLDDGATMPGEQAEYELWLRGLSSYPVDFPRFQAITRGLLALATAKAAFYTSIEGPERMEQWRSLRFAPDAWAAKHPLAARFGILDLWWLARLLRADVSSVGRVAYGEQSWLSLLAHRSGEGAAAQSAQIARDEEVLRAVFDFACDVVQNAAHLAADTLARRQSPDQFPEWPESTIGWRAMYDEELEEIALQRKERRFDDTTQFARASSAGERRDAGPAGWSRRVRTGEHVEDLIGLALSGGGIRSATFNLGVLQGLQELDLLGEVDYLSTVSGGGYIGAWLLGNVRRTRYWLSRLTDWNPSIEHLRRFSHYLAPHSGLMSADTWTMWGSFVRNAVLIQLSAATWVAVLLVLTRLNRAVFASDAFSTLAYDPANLVLAPTLLLLTASIYRNLRQQSRSNAEWHVLAFAVLPAWIGSFLTAAMLWASRTGSPYEYSEVLATAWGPWRLPLALLFVSFWLVSALSIESGRLRAAAAALLVAIGPIAVVYLGLAGLWWQFGRWSVDDTRFVWYAYAAGPPIVLLIMTLGVVMMIGLIGHASPDWRREWWTRLGSWLGIYGVGFLSLSAVSVFGPPVALWLFSRQWGAIEWGTVLGWVGTVAGGLFTGNSERTNGDASNTLIDAALGWFTKIAAVIFIIGAVLIASVGLHALLVRVWTNDTLASDYWLTLQAIGVRDYVWTLVVLLILGCAFSWRFEINVFGLNQFYRNRLVRCYLGATRWRPGLRRPHKFTGFDPQDDLPMSQFLRDAVGSLPYGGPFPLVNCALNLGGSSDLSVHTRHSASFVLTPLRAGADRTRVGYAPARHPGNAFAGGVQLGQAISVSGAAASPNMGYNTSPLVAFLLTMFNVRLGWWFPNPGRRFWNTRWLAFSLWYLVKEMFALADERNYFVNVSDGGHFENLGIYELVRRRCKVIIACDAECDPALTFGSLGSVVRMCDTDFGAKIEIDVGSIRRQKESGASRAHCAVGRISYANGSRGYLVYLKASLTGDEDIGIAQYKAGHPDFPHQSTADQFFAEDQFESYRRLGHHVARMTFRDVTGAPNLVAMAGTLLNLWTPASMGSESFVDQADALDAIWERFRTSPTLSALLHEITADRRTIRVAPPSDEELCVCLELFQHMENVFLALRLDEFWTHPDNRGWVTLFRSWAKSPTIRTAWGQSSNLFGIRFVHFCRQRLGL